MLSMLPSSSSSSFLIEFGLVKPFRYRHSKGMVGNNGSNVIEGRNSHDTLRGLGGNDVLIGLAGTDTLDGGSGNDTVDYSFSASYIPGLGGYGSDPAFMPRTTYIDLTGGYGRDQYGYGDIYKSIENVDGGQQKDIIIGNSQDNVLAGYGGNDRLIGGYGDDILAGGEGRDILRGGKGKDLFAFTYSDRVSRPDVITDFQTGQDKLLVVGDSFYSDLQFNFHSSFPELLPEDWFFLGSRPQGSSDIWGYDQRTGNVIFDSDGSGGAKSTIVATLKNKPTDFSASDIFIA